jgi:hypothetical protein
LFEVVASLLVTKPAFDGERLVDDFLETLKSNSLITKQELREHRTDISILVQLYALSMMHNCVVKIRDDKAIQLKGACHEGSENISVSAAIPMPITKTSLSPLRSLK